MADGRHACFQALEVAGLLLLSSLLIAYFQQYYNRLCVRGLPCMVWPLLPSRTVVASPNVRYEVATAVHQHKERAIRNLSLMLAFRVMQLIDEDELTQRAIGLGRNRRVKGHAMPSGGTGSLHHNRARPGTFTRGAQAGASGDGARASPLTLIPEAQPVDSSYVSSDEDSRDSHSTGSDAKADAPPSSTRPRARKQLTLNLNGNKRPALVVDTAAAEDSATAANLFVMAPMPGRDRHARLLRRISTAAEVLLNTHSLATSVSERMFIRFFSA